MSDYYLGKILANARDSRARYDDGWDELRSLEFAARQRSLSDIGDNRHPPKCEFVLSPMRPAEDRPKKV